MCEFESNELNVSGLTFNDSFCSQLLRLMYNKLFKMLKINIPGTKSFKSRTKKNVPTTC